ncbi:MAG: LptF/LptG family permease, partial [Pseudomonadota bacterium]
MGRFLLAFFGVASRRAVRDYLVFTGLFALILLAVAWTIDLADNFDEVQWVADVRQQPLYEVLLPYLTYRAVDIVLRLLPVSIFFGIFIAEIYRRARLDTVILSAAGAGPLRLLGPIALYGAIMGAANWALESYGRPAAIEAQIKLG